MESNYSWFSRGLMERHDQFQGSNWRSRAFYSTNHLYFGARNYATSFTDTFPNTNGKPNTFSVTDTFANS